MKYIIAIITGVALLVIRPALTFGCAYIGGMVLDFFVGEGLVNGLNIMFDTSRFTRDLIPLTCATLATIGRYFKSTNNVTNENKEKSIW